MDQIRNARETYEQTPVGEMGYFAFYEHDEDELQSLQHEFELLEGLAAIGNIEIEKRIMESWTGNSWTMLISFRRLA